MNRKRSNVKSDAHRARGFTLVEILVALAVLVILGAVLYPALMGEIHFSERATTRARLTVLRRAVNEAYMRHAMAIDTLAPRANTIALNTASTYTLTTGAAFQPGNPDAFQNGFQMLAQYADTPTRALVTDGFGRPWAVFVSDPLTTVKDGVTLTYHTIAFVSNDGGPENAQGQILNAATTFDPTTGVLTLGGHDVGVIINGAVVERRLLRRTLRTMRLIAGEYATFFTTQYESNINRDISVDYFASAPPGSTNPALWDSASPIGNSANGNGPGYAFPGPLPAGAAASGTLTGPSVCDMQPATAIGFATTLGLSPDALTSAWGYDLGVGNGPNSGSGAGTCYGDDRDPQSANGALTSPPYTALIGAWAPGGTLVTVPVVGAY
ncbi:MAG: type II secretion system protein [Gammaproteobacteria bacterium]|nr:type II secretion system protein [Gammaproteobacteria bacterium]